MIYSYYIAFAFTAVTLFLASILLSFGPCYNGCEFTTQLYHSRYLIPFIGTLGVLYYAIVYWHRTRDQKLWHAAIAGITGLIFLGLSIFAILIDPGDMIIYSVFLICGLLIGQPYLVYRRKSKR